MCQKALGSSICMSSLPEESRLDANAWKCSSWRGTMCIPRRLFVFFFLTNFNIYLQRRLVKLVGVNKAIFAVW